MKILVVGDSLTVGMTPFLIQELGDRRFTGRVVGKTGWTSARWARSGLVERLVGEVQPERVVYLLGTNDDPFDGASTQELIRLAGVPVIWIGPFHSTTYDADYRRILGGAYLPGTPLAEGIPHAADGIHFATSGYQALAKRVAAAHAAHRRGLPPWLVILLAVVGTFGVIAVFSSRRAQAAWEAR